MKTDTLTPTKKVAIKESRLEDIFKEMSEWSDRIAKRAFDLFAASGFTNGHDLEDWFKAEKELLKPLALDVKDLASEFVVTAEVPGFEANELNIHVTGQHLIIEGKREFSDEKKEKGVTGTESKSEEIYRAVELPAPVLAEEATSELKNGILKLKLPKAAKPRQIKIAAA
jgi:HSP20 family protein